ncbi:hypothetical protein MOX02_50570 [Methylobacterium oxalidis]|uniref:Uncharacterized protein n=1 Tax=Methylobacterium oxalidis TaxID=944322 RepID=A0A512JAV7_9HYPH|nr:hypothetical protein MOX02_50570 [Methylobacterium oxalidis]
MIGPAELEDMLAEYADAQQPPDELTSTELSTSPLSHWSWGSGPTAAVVCGQDPVTPLAVDPLRSQGVH